MIAPPEVRMSSLFRAFALCVALALAGGGCAKFTDADQGTPAGLVALAGSGQTGTVGVELNEPLLVKVVDAAGRGIPDRKVRFRVAAGDGSLSVITAVTDAAGRAQTRWTLGRSALMPQAVEAATVRSPVLFARFDAIALADAPAQVDRISGEGQEGVTGLALEAPFVVRVRDRYDNPVVGAPVAWAVTEGGGSLSQRIGVTDGAGNATTHLTLGPWAGTNRVSATLGELPPVTFTAVARSGRAASLAPSRATMQSGPVGGTLPDSLAVRALDAWGNPVPGVMVEWWVRAGGGSISPRVSRTDAEGFARAQWTLGMELDTLQVTAASAASLPVVTFAARAVVPSVAQLSKLSDQQSGEAGEVLPEPLTVMLRLADGRPLAGVPVTWVVLSGGGAVSAKSATTDADGRASTRFKLGPTPGTNSASAAVPGMAPAVFTATARAGEAAKLIRISGDGQVGTAGLVLSEALTVKLVDRLENPVSGRTVTWTVVEGGGSVSSASATTDLSGMATARWKLGTAVGEQVLEARASGLAGVRFRARGAMASSATITRGFDQQTAPVGDTLPRWITVVVRHADGRPAAGVPVTWSVTSGGGETTSPNPVETDENGVAGVRWRLGSTPGVNTATATVLGLPAVTFTATGYVAAQTSLVPWSGTLDVGSGTTGEDGLARARPTPGMTGGRR